MIVKIHRNKTGNVVAACDEDILGKKFEEGKLQLDLTTDFYKGEKKTDSEVLKIISNSYVVSFVGEKCVEFAIKNRLVDKDKVLVIAGVPHAQCIIEK